MRLSTPPRHVPLPLRIVNLFNGTALLGWFIFGFGMLYFWTMVMRSDFSYINFRGETRTVRGRITRVEETRAKESKRPVFAYHYGYSVEGKTYTGTSFSTGTRAENGDAVRVLYLRADPARSRIAGMRPALFSSAVQLIVAIPIAGALIAISGTRSGLKRSHLLMHGLLTSGKLIDKTATNIRENKKTVYALTFEFTTRDGRRQSAVTRSSETARLEDETQEQLLYDPSDPSRAYLLDELPARPQIDAAGELVGNPRAAATALVVPLLVVLENLLFALRYAL